MGTGLAAHPHHCRQYFRSTAAWGEPLKARSHRISIARVRRLEKVKSMGRYSPPQTSLMTRNGGLPVAGRPECMKSLPSLRLHRVRARNGKLKSSKATLLYQRTQYVLQAARLLPAHRQLPHPAFLSGLWWKLLSLQPLRLLFCLPELGSLRPTEEAEPPHFTVNGFSAGSYTGAVIASAIRLWPGSQITARLGAIAMPRVS